MFFELEDIRRRHTVYSDIYNVGVWVEAPDNTLRWNVTRGAIAGISGHLLGEYFHNIFINWKLLAKQYVAPQGALGHIKFLLATQGTENYKKSLRTRAQYALTIGAIDWGSRIAAYRWVNNGWQKNYGGFEHGFVRKIPGSIFIAALTAPIGVPFELARIAYYADKTFPKELQRGYTSYFNALLRIPIEEGPYYLFKNSFPIYSRNFIQTLTLFYSFDWMKDKLSLFTRLSEIPYIYIKAINCTLATSMAIAFSYPFGNTSKEMVDLWPKKSANAPHPFLNNYRDAASHIWYTNFLNNYYPGMLKNYASRSFLSLFTTLWVADSFGIFSYWKIDMFSGQGTNSWEDTFS